MLQKQIDEFVIFYVEMQSLYGGCPHKMICWLWLHFLAEVEPFSFDFFQLQNTVEVERAENFSAHEPLSWADLFQMVSRAELSFFRFWIWRAELSWAFSDFDFGELSWAELSSSWTSQKTSSNWNLYISYGELNELDTLMCFYVKWALFPQCCKLMREIIGFRENN